MFIPLFKILSLNNFKLENKVKSVDVCLKSEEIINKIVKSKVQVVKYKDKSISVKVTHFLIANQIKLKENLIKNTLKQNSVLVNKINTIIS